MYAFIRKRTGPDGAGIEALDAPVPGAGEVLVEVAGCGICGSDLHAIAGDPGFEWVRTPVIMGHEFCGVVRTTGPQVSGFHPGDVVVPMAIQGCLTCDVCRQGATQRCARRRIIGLNYDGGLADQAVVPAVHLVPVPAGVPAETAVITEPLSVAVRATLNRVSIGPSDRVVVSGPGPIGILCGLLAQLAGARVLLLGGRTDVDRRLPLGEQAGLRTAVADDLEGPPALYRELGGHAPDLWVEASGSSAALLAAIEGTRIGGTISIVSLFGGPTDIFMTQAVRSELTLRCSYASARPDYLRALDLLAFGDIQPAFLQDRYPLADAAQAVADARTSKTMKPLIVP